MLLEASKENLGNRQWEDFGEIQHVKSSIKKQHPGLNSYAIAEFREETDLQRMAWDTARGVLGGVPVSPCMTNGFCLSAFKININNYFPLYHSYQYCDLTDTGNASLHTPEEHIVLTLWISSCYPNTNKN